MKTNCFGIRMQGQIIHKADPDQAYKNPPRPIILYNREVDKNKFM